MEQAKKSPRDKWESIKGMLLDVDSLIKILEHQNPLDGEKERITQRKVDKLVNFINTSLTNALK